MSNTFALIFSFFGMACSASSYLLKKKWQFLIAQGGSILFIAVSNLFLALYYACVSSVVSLVRVIVYYCLEKHDKEANFYVKSLFAGLVVLSYLITNVIILKNYMWQDIMLMAINCSFVYIVGIRNLKLLRYCILTPVALAVLYCVLMNAAIFTTCSYAIELVVNIVAIIIYSRKSEKETDDNASEKLS